MLLPLLRHMVPLNDRNCHLTMPVGKGRCTRDALPHSFSMGVFKSFENKSTTTKLTYNEYGNIIEGCNVAFDASDSWNFP